MPISILDMDDPRHGELRALVNRGFTPRRVAEIEPAVRSFVVDRIERLREAGAGDVVAELAKPLPSFVVGHYLGVDPADRLAAAASLAAAGARIDELRAATAGETFSLPALNPRHDSTPFEKLRRAALEHEKSGGDRPQIYLACMGSIASHVNFANWAKSFFEVAGVETVPSGALEGNEAQAKTLSDGGFELAAICAGRNQTPEDVADLAGKLRAAGATYIFMVNSTPELNEAAIGAGADELVKNGVNLIEVLTATLGRLGVEVKS